MPSKNPYDQATKTTAVDGEVVLDGPDGIGLSMTPEAAAETGRRLTAAARKARAQVDGARRSQAQDRDSAPED